MPTIQTASTTSKGATSAIAPAKTVSPYTTNLADGSVYDPMKSLPQFLRDRLAVISESDEVVANWCEPARQLLTSSRYRADRIAQVYPRRDAIVDGKLLPGIEVSKTWAEDDRISVIRWTPSEDAESLLDDPRAFFEAGSIDLAPLSEVITTNARKPLCQPHYRSNFVRVIEGKDGARDLYIVNCEFTALISEKRTELAKRLGVEVKDIPDAEKGRQVRVSVRTRGDSKGDTCMENRSVGNAVGKQFYIVRLMALLDCLRQAQTMHALAGKAFAAKSWTTAFLEVELGYYGYAYPVAADATDEQKASQAKTVGLHAFAKSVNDADGIAHDLPESYLFRGEVLSVG